MVHYDPRSAMLIALLILTPTPAPAQSINWDGQTGFIVAPTAMAVKAPANGVSLPVASFQLLNAGDVIGTRFQIALTVGIGDRAEAGFTRSAVSTGTDELNKLFDRGFSNAHGKLVLIREAGDRGRPGVALGGIVRWQQQHIEGGLGVATRNADAYVVVTKTFNVAADWGVLVNGGGKVTNAALYGIAGNAPGWSARVFGGVGFVRRDLFLAGALRRLMAIVADSFRIPCRSLCV